MYHQNECQIVGEIQDRLSLRWTKKGFPQVEFYLKTQKVALTKKNTMQTLRCICRGPQAIYISEKVNAGDRVIVKGALDSVSRCFEDGFYYEVTILVKQCIPMQRSYFNER